MHTQAPTVKKKTLSFLARNVKAWRLHRDMTQKELAFEGDTNEAYICKIERGRHTPQEEMIAQLAVALKIQPATLRFNPPA